MTLSARSKNTEDFAYDSLRVLHVFKNLQSNDIVEVIVRKIKSFPVIELYSQRIISRSAQAHSAKSSKLIPWFDSVSVRALLKQFENHSALPRANVQNSLSSISPTKLDKLFQNSFWNYPLLLKQNSVTAKFVAKSKLITKVVYHCYLNCISHVFGISQRLVDVIIIACFRTT